MTDLETKLARAIANLLEASQWRVQSLTSAEKNAKADALVALLEYENSP